MNSKQRMFAQIVFGTLLLLLLGLVVVLLIAPEISKVPSSSRGAQAGCSGSGMDDIGGMIFVKLDICNEGSIIILGTPSAGIYMLPSGGGGCDNGPPSRSGQWVLGKTDGQLECTIEMYSLGSYDEFSSLLGTS